MYGQRDADRGAGERGGQERRARAALEERDAAGADDEDDECLGRERLDEPAGAEQGRAGVEDAQHDGEGEEVVDARDRAEERHEAADQADVPLRGAGEQLLVDVVGRDRHLADVVEEVVEQDLRRQHRQERQEQRGAGGGEHVPEVRRGAHQDVLDRVGEDAPALDDAVGDDAEVLVEQDDVGGVLGDVGGRVDRDADVGVVERDRVVDAVAEEADVDAERALGADDARLLLRGDPGEDRRLRQQLERARRRPAPRARRRS